MLRRIASLVTAVVLALIAAGLSVFPAEADTGSQRMTYGQRLAWWDTHFDSCITEDSRNCAWDGADMSFVDVNGRARYFRQWSTYPLLAQRLPACHLVGDIDCVQHLRDGRKRVHVRTVGDQEWTGYLSRSGRVTSVRYDPIYLRR